MVAAEFSLEERQAMHSFSYESYILLGGIINKNDCESALLRVNSVNCGEHFIGQAERIAKVAGITLNNTRFHLDEITALYGVLRNDLKPGAEYHHGQMSDERLFIEAIRMLNRPDLLEKIIIKYPQLF